MNADNYANSVITKRVLDERNASANRRKAILAGVIAHVLEWYEFGIYGFLAVILSKRFFPAGDQNAVLLATFAAFGAGFLARPLGSLMLGRLADTHGRKNVMALTLLLMAASTLVIGLLPTYENLGVISAVGLVIARLLQGFAAGGEWGSSTAFIVEWAGPKRRGFCGSFQQSSMALGLLLASAAAATLNTVLSADDIASWGWRIPFVVGGVLGLFGLYIRRNMSETPIYEHDESGPPVGEPFNTSLVLTIALRLTPFVALWGIASYVVFIYFPTYGQAYLGMSGSKALWSSTLSLALLIVLLPAVGLISDRIGRKPLLIAGCAGFLLLSYPLFQLLLNTQSTPLFFAVQSLLVLLYALIGGVGPACLTEMFPTANRAVGISIGGALAGVMGGFSPLAITWLIGVFQSPIISAVFLVVAAAISLPAFLRFRETAFKALD